MAKEPSGTALVNLYKVESLALRIHTLAFASFTIEAVSATTPLTEYVPCADAKKETTQSRKIKVSFIFIRLIVAARYELFF